MASGSQGKPRSVEPLLTTTGCHEAALVTDRAGTFATVLSKPVPRLVEGGRIVVTTLGTFHQEREALAFLREVRWVDEHERERKPWDLEALERHGLAPTPPPATL